MDEAAAAAAAPLASASSSTLSSSSVVSSVRFRPLEDLLRDRADEAARADRWVLTKVGARLYGAIYCTTLCNVVTCPFAYALDFEQMHRV